MKVVSPVPGGTDVEGVVTEFPVTVTATFDEAGIVDVLLDVSGETAGIGAAAGEGDKDASDMGPLPGTAVTLLAALVAVFDRVADQSLTVRRVQVAAGRLEEMGMDPAGGKSEQLDLFSDPAAEEQARQARQNQLQRERQAQQAVLDIRKKFGGNAILKGMDLKDGATTKDRNAQIGGHKA